MNNGFKDKQKFDSLKEVKTPSWMTTLARILVSFFVFFCLLLIVTPWQQTSQGTGKVIAFDPNDRVQVISSTVPGRIEKWLVRDGSKVKKGDPLVQIVDNDPNFIKRLRIERDAILRKYEAAKAASETSLLNYERQEQLFEQGLSSRMKFEKSKIEYKKLLAAEATVAANLATAEVRLSRQQNQLITAPRDGTVLRVLKGSGSVFVKEGDTLATFVPDSLNLAVELYIDGNDLPLVYPGRHVRLQFEGWPAVQFSGWPSIAVGTFAGQVTIVDPSASKDGQFRVIIVPEDGENWPDTTYLRQGTRAYGWILLNSVKLGYELWRQFNGFPASMESNPDDIYSDKKKSSKSDKEKRKDFKDVYDEK